MKASRLELFRKIMKTCESFKRNAEPDSFPVPTYLFFKGDERPGRNDVKVAGQAGKGERKVGSLPDFRAAFP